MENRSARTTVSILQTTLLLLKDDPSIRADSEAALAFREAALRLIAEVQKEHRLTETPRAEDTAAQEGVTEIGIRL